MLVLLAISSQWWLVGSWIFGELMNKLSHQPHVLTGVSVTMLIVLVALTDVVFRTLGYIRNTILQKTSRIINDRVQKIFWDSYVRYDLQDRESKKMQDALANARDNQGAISELLQTELDFISNTIIFVAALAALASIVWWGIPILLCAVIPRLFLIWRRKNKQYKNEKSRQEINRYQSALSGFIGTKDARINEARYPILSLFNSIRVKANAVSLKNNLYFYKINWYNDLLFYIAETAILLYLASKIGAGVVSVGILFVFFNSFNRLYESLVNISEKIVTLGITMKKASDFYLVLENNPAITDAVHASEVDNTKAPGIEFRNVWFKYPESEDWILRDCSFSIAAGERVGLVGRNGEGKTTLALLLMRFYDVTEGSILVNGIDIRLIRRDTLLGITGTLFQDFKLLEGSVRFAMTAFNFRKSFSDHQLWGALEKVGMDMTVKKFKHGLHHKISKLFDESKKLSGGQNQKVALAGVIGKEPKLLILDEFTSALDAEAVASIVKAYDDISKGKTCLIISHQFNTLDMVDRVVVLHEGRIAENGKKSELLTVENGIFKQLYSASRLMPTSLS